MKRTIFLLSMITAGFLIYLLSIPKKAMEPNKSITKIGDPPNLDPYAKNLTKSEPPKIEQLRSLIESDNAPIKFYGLVVDEKGSPLSDVVVSWHVLKSGSFIPSLGFPTGAEGDIHTDSQGKFSIIENGSSLSVRTIVKKGYRQGRRMQASYGYGSNAAPYQPDESKPERFLMIKDTAQASIKVDVPLKFNWDGLPKVFEIGPKVFSNKIILIPTREKPISIEQEYNWKLVIKASDGQLILAKDGDAPLAPDSGYTESIVFQKDIGGQRGSCADARIYLKTNSGKYAELRISAYSDRGLEDSSTGYIDIRWNPDGGRTFE
jgi:hypothetical protein